MTPKAKILNYLERNDFITMQEALKHGVNKMSLSRMVREGTLYRTAKRIYTKNLDWLTGGLRRYAPVCTLYPSAVICGISALTYYDLTDEEERKIWLAFPRHNRVVNHEYRMIYPSGSSYSLGITLHKFRNREVRIYDIEKTVVDAFKYLPIDAAHKVLRAYLKRKDKDIDKLSRYAKEMRKPLDSILTVLLSDE